MKKILLFSLFFWGITVLSAQTVQTVQTDVRLDKRKSAGLEILSSDYSGMRIKNALSVLDAIQKYSYAGEGEYLNIEVQGYAYTNRIGYPRLPLRVEIIELPQNAEAEVVILKTSYKVLDLEREILPVQGPKRKDATEEIFHKEAAVYSSDEYLKDDLVRIEYMGEYRGVRLAKLIISPFQYNPQKSKLRICTRLDFEVEFKNSDPARTVSQKRKFYSPAFAPVQKGTLNHLGEDRHRSADDIRPMQYVIISDPLFEEALQPFVQWKTQLGFDVHVAYTSQEEVGRTKESIKSYLSNLYYNGDPDKMPPSYLLLVGDVAQIPAFKSKLGSYPGISDYNQHFTDLYYGEYSGDFLPEVMVGRFSATTVEEVESQVEKTIYMQKLQSTMGFLDTNILVSGNDSRFGYSHLNPTLQYAYDYYFHDSLGLTTYYYPYPTSSSKTSEIIKKINEGLAVVWYTGHGSSRGFADPSITTYEVNQFTNKGKYPFIVGNCCLTGTFDNPECFGEKLLRVQNKGAVGYIGASNSTYFDEDFYWAVGYVSDISSKPQQYTYEGTGMGAFDGMFHSHGEAFPLWLRSAGEIMHGGNFSVEISNSSLKNYYWEVYHMFGDPSHMPMVGRGEVSRYVQAVPVLEGATSCQIATDPYATVSFSREGVLYGSGRADSLGQLQLNFKPVFDMDSMEVVVSNQFKRPYIGKIAVGKNTGSCLFIEEMVLKQGNQAVEVLEYGKEYQLSMKVKNIGEQPVTGPEFSISSVYPELEFPLSNYRVDGNWSVGETRELKDVFTVKVSPEIGVDQFAYIEVKVDKQMEGTNRFKKNIALKGVELGLSQNLKVKSGTSTKLVLGKEASMEFKLKNNGDVDATPVTLHLSSDKDYIEILNPEIRLDIAAHSEVPVTFDVKVKETALMYEIVTLQIGWESRGKEREIEAYTYVGEILEDFETGDFKKIPWLTASNWEISEEVAWDGQYSAVSRKIGDKGLSVLAITVDVTMEDSISFYYKTSTERQGSDRGDFLKFYDGRDLVQSWAGEKGWTRFAYLVSVGRHTFKWMYEKNVSGSAGKDRVWIDHLVMPLGTLPPQVGNETGKELLPDGSGMQLFSTEEGLGVRIDLPGTDRGDLYWVDAQGHSVQVLEKDWTVSSSETRYYSFSNLAPGVYICVFQGQQYRLVQKFVKL